MSEQQQRTAQILERLDSGRLTISDVCSLLGKSQRQVYRLKRSYSANGMACVIHGNHSRQPVNGTCPDTIKRIVELAGKEGAYKDFNTCHLAEMLQRNHDISIGRSTLDRILIAAGLRKREKPGVKVARKRRKRRASEGAMLQIDGSFHAWFGESFPSACLLGAIDDATGKIVGALYRPSEDQAGYLTLMRGIAEKYGLPASFYHDKHTILRSPKEPTIEDELAGRLPRSQVQRVLDLLGIESIAAHSPQAKGRIERLWGTLQDRLCKELAAKGITNITEANGYLAEFVERYNTSFAHVPANPESAWVPIEPGMDLDYYFSAMEIRVVKPDNTLSFLGKTYQLKPDKKGPSLVNQKVEVHTLPDGTVAVYCNKVHIPSKMLSEPPPKQIKPAKDKPILPKDPAKVKVGRRRQMAYLHTPAT